ncbi:unnamed protein product [Lampetra planeri]
MLMRVRPQRSAESCPAARASAATVLPSRQAALSPITSYKAIESPFRPDNRWAGQSVPRGDGRGARGVGSGPEQQPTAPHCPLLSPTSSTRSERDSSERHTTLTPASRRCTDRRNGWRRVETCTDVIGVGAARCPIVDQPRTGGGCGSQAAHERHRHRHPAGHARVRLLASVVPSGRKTQGPAAFQRRVV